MCSAAKTRELVFEFRYEGKTTFTLKGSWYSSFVGCKGIVYFAKYDAARPGCSIVAIDSHAGTKLWERELAGVKSIAHSLYSNHVIVEGAGSMPDSEITDVKTILVRGHEDGGNYRVVLDAATGEVLAEKQFDSVTPTQ